MFRFEHPEYLRVLWALPVLVLVWVAWWLWRRRAMAQLADAAVAGQLIPGFSGRRFWVKSGLLLLALALLAFSWANPQRGAKQQTALQQSADVFIAFDISQSMLAEDLRPNRLVLARIFAQKLVQALAGQRVGLIFFAGDAYVQMPLSTDYDAAISFLTEASPDLMTMQGTAIPAAISRAEEAFDPETPAGRALVLITDGEDHDEGAVDKAAEAHDNGLLIMTVGAGTTAGGPIPWSADGAAGYKRDEKGNLVRTSLNETLLRDVARAGGGQAYHISQGDEAVEAIRKTLDALEKHEVAVRSYTEFESYYQWLLLPALLLLLAETWIFWKKSS
ncbi:MAG: VWA domain-containing protein [Saprospiraceae bacterium]